MGLFRQLGRAYLVDRLLRGGRGRHSAAGRSSRRYGGRRPRGRGGFYGPFPYYSGRTRRGSRVTVSGCCLPIPLGMLAATRWGLGSSFAARSRCVIPLSCALIAGAIAAAAIVPSTAAAADGTSHDLRVTGERRGGVLGSLFCSLANAKVKTSRVAAASRLNSQMRRSGTLRPLGLTVPVTAVAAQVPTCQVLDLTVGPLNVDLLGLIVDLKKVHLTITATPGGGVLGNLFCGLANGPSV